MKALQSKKISDAGLSTFAEALSVPQLAQACCKVFSDDELLPGKLPGASLKKLRLVCKAVKTSLYQVVQKFTLQLELGVEATADTHRVVSFLKGTRLIRLSIVFPVLTTAGNTRSRRKATAQDAARMHTFVTQLGPTLSGITRLRITLPSATGPDVCETAATKALLAPLLALASACPNLKKLSVTGRVGPSFLQHFGSNCRKLEDFHGSFTNLATSTLEQLPVLLPNLTSLGVQPYRAHYSLEKLLSEDDHPVDHVLSNAATCVALKASPNLLHFESDSYEMTEAVWAALPLGVTRCAAPGAGRWYRDAYPLVLPTWKQHSSLTSLTLTHQVACLPDMVQMLAAAPNLSLIILGNALTSIDFVQTDIRLGLAEQLRLLNARMESGLVFATLESGPQSVIVPHQPILVFLADSGCLLSSFVSADWPVLSRLERLQFFGGHGTTGGDLSHFPRVFPSVRDLGFRSIDMAGSNLQALATCPALKLLGVDRCAGVTREGLEALCTASRSLRQLSCSRCNDISEEDRRVLECMDWGKAAALGLQSQSGVIPVQPDASVRGSRLRNR